MSRPKWILSALAVCLAVAPGPVLAQKPGQARAKARRHYEQATAYERAKDWDRAIAEYEEAQSLYPSPEFDFLIAEVELKRGNEEAALERYEKYLAAEPNGRVAGKARESIARLRAELEAERAARRQAEERARAEQAREDARKRDEESRARRARDAADRSATPTVDSRPDEAEAPEAAGRTLRLSGLIVAGGGLVAVAFGVKFGLDARSAAGDVEARWDAERYDEGKAADTRMKVFSAIGSVAVLGGGVLYYLGRRAGRAASEERVTLAPGAAPGFVGLQVRGGF